MQIFFWCVFAMAFLTMISAVWRVFTICHEREPVLISQRIEMEERKAAIVAQFFLGLGLIGLTMILTLFI